MTSAMRTASTSRGRARASRGRAAARTGRGSLVFLAAAALLALATGCGSQSGGSPHSYPTSQTKVSADVGEKFTLTVDENTSTGEHWYLAAPKPAASVVRSKGDDYNADKGTEDQAGAGGKRVFTFEATGAGSTEIVLLHCPVYTCTGGKESPATASPTASAASRPAPKRITYTVTVS